MELVEIMEALEAIKAVVDVIDGNTSGETEFLPPSIIEFLESLSDEEQGNNDVEAILVDIRNSLMYDEENTAIYELSSRLELIDARLDSEFEVLNFGISVIGSVVLATAAIKFLSWIYRFVSL